MANWFTRRFSTPEPMVEEYTKAIVVNVGTQQLASLLSGTPGPKQMLEYYRSSTSVAIPINMVVDPFSVMEPVLKEAKTEEVDRDHPVVKLMRKPSMHWSREHFQQKLGIEYLACGECFPIFIGNHLRPPLNIEIISPSEITPTMGSDGWTDVFTIGGMFMPGTYRQMVNDRRELRYYSEVDDFSEVIPIRRFSTKDNSLNGGESVFTAAINDILQNILGGEHNIALLKNGGKISLVFNYEQDFAPKAFEALKNSIIEKYSGSSKAGQIAVTAGGKLTVNDLGASMVDMDFVNLQDRVDKKVAQILNVPLPLMTVDATTMNNYERAILALYDNCVIPLSKMVYGGISDKLLPLYGLDPTEYRITYDREQVSALIMRMLEETEKRVKTNIYKHDEMRKPAGLGPLEGGVGNKVYHNMSMVPLGEGGKDRISPKDDDAAPGNTAGES